jgi:hypothetical protein
MEIQLTLLSNEIESILKSKLISLFDQFCKINNYNANLIFINDINFEDLSNDFQFNRFSNNLGIIAVPEYMEYLYRAIIS